MLLSTHLWVSALIRRAELAGAYATVVRRGDAGAGAVLVKVLDRRAGTVRLYAEAVGPGGERVWMQPLPEADETRLDAYAERTRSFDPDLWVVEIEDGRGRHFLTEPVDAR